MKIIKNKELLFFLLVISKFLPFTWSFRKKNILLYFMHYKNNNTKKISIIKEKWYVIKIRKTKGKYDNIDKRKDRRNIAWIDSFYLKICQKLVNFMKR
jgi:hypothetical protein